MIVGSKHDPVRLIACVLLAFGFGACTTSPWAGGEPREVDDLVVTHSRGNLMVSWTNPTDYHRVRVSLTGTGVTRDSDGVRVRQGVARAVFADLKEGSYKVAIIAETTEDTSSRRVSELPIDVPPQLRGYCKLEDLGRAVPESHDVVFLIHAGAEIPHRHLFEQLTANVLSVVFKSAIRLPSESSLGDIEGVGDTKWPVYPAIVVLVDYRPPSSSGGVPAQLGVRLLDVAQTAARPESVTSLKLYNDHPLIVEAFAEVAGGEGHLDAERDALRDGWRRVLDELLESPRYRLYSKPPTVPKELAGDGTDVMSAEQRISAKDLTDLLLYGTVPDSLAISRSALDQDKQKAMTGGDVSDRADLLERLLLFGPDRKWK